MKSAEKKIVMGEGGGMLRERIDDREDLRSQLKHRRMERAGPRTSLLNKCVAKIDGWMER